MTTNAKTTVGRRTLLATAVLAVGLGWGSGALAGGPGLVDLRVVDRETGRTLPFWRAHGEPFVAGEPGARYGLRVSNRTDGRVLLVLSVDGVNVFTGETARSSQRGYVLNAHESYDVNGWRKSEQEVAAFTFAPLPRSYAARTGRPGDVGVIGMAVFQEREPVAPSEDAEPAPRRPWRGRTVDRAMPPPPLPLPPLNVPPPAPLARAAPSVAAPKGAMSESRSPPVADAFAQRRDEKLGTGHGAREASAIVMVDFERSTSSPVSLRRIEYDTASNLRARGVTPPEEIEHRPRAFPLDSGGSGFVPDPPRGR